MRYVLPLLALSLAAAQIPGTSVSLQPPPGLQPASRFPGFENTETGSSILVSELAAPFVAATAGLRDRARMEAQNMTVLKTEHVKLAATDADLFTLDQRHNGVVYRKLILALGDEKRTILVTATFDSELAISLEPVFRASLLTLTLSARQPESLGYRVEPRGALQQVRVVSGSLAFTRNGVFPLANPGAPIYIASRSVAPLPVASLSEFAETRARALPGGKDLRVTSSRPITINGLTGHELIAATAELVIHQVVLRDPAGGYYLLLGRVSPAESAALLPVFAAMSATFRRD